MSIVPEDLDQEAFGRWLIEYLEANPLPQNAVTGLPVNVEGGKVNSIALINAWADLGGGFAPLSYRSLPGGLIQVRGVVSAAAAASGTVMGVVPVKPKEALQFPANNGVASAAVTILPTGEILGYFEGGGSSFTVNALYGAGV